MDNEKGAARSAASDHDGRVSLVLVGCSGLLGDILGRTVAASPAIDVVASVDSVADLDAAGISSADMVLWNNADDDTLERWLNREAAARPRVLGTMADGRQASLWELAPRRTRLGSMSPDDVVRAITGDLRDSPRGPIR